MFDRSGDCGFKYLCGYIHPDTAQTVLNINGGKIVAKKFNILISREFSSK